jgi:GNAT superfamily N-acetyltransferase
MLHRMTTTAPPAAPWALRSARESDVPFLLSLREQAMAPHHLAAGIVQSLAESEARVRDHFDSAQVIELAGQPIGLWKVRRDPGEWWILQVQIMPAHQGQGIGGQLVGALVAEARAAGMALCLTVLKANPARRLYERHGFALITEDEFGCTMRVSTG